MGTAGHIDHGKTSLVKALTGYDADRLREEKERGITIVLGFCSLATKSGDEISIIDVPGHEKFIRTMISGAAGMDMVMLVIAADDGVMPQTREHLDICRLLGIKHGVIALTKIDLVEKDWLELVQNDIKKTVSGTFFQDAPIIPVSVVTNEGVDTLKKAVEDTANKVIERQISGLARLPVDRIFTMKGFGTVITGTLISGKLCVGDDVELLPSGKNVKIRSLQQHGKKTNEALAGSRVAVNLTSLEKDESVRGELLVKKGSFRCCELLDVHLINVSAEKTAIKNLTRLRFLTLTSRAMAEIHLLSNTQIKPGEEAFAQIRLDKPLPCVVDDRFILLGTSNIQTIGGGTILNPFAEKRAKKNRQSLLEELKAIKDSDTASRAEIFIKKSAASGMSIKELSQILNIKQKVLTKELSRAISGGTVLQYDPDAKSFVICESFDKAKENILGILKDFHLINPAKAGIIKEELRGKACKSMPDKLYESALNALVKLNKAVISSELVLLKEYEENVSEFAQKIKKEIESIYNKSGLTPPFLQELKTRLSRHKPSHIDDTVSVLVRDKRLIRISEGYYLHEDNFSRLKEELVKYLKENKKIDAAGFKSITQTSRKYTIPLLERFDMLGITIRQEDNTRILNN
jgi:selenocysteine-specific elongation factor